MVKKKKKNFGYRVAKIPKRDGTSRLLEIPSDDLKKEQKKILRNIVYKIGVHRACHGFVRNKSPVTNAKVHTDSSIIIKLDIKDFFTTSKARYVASSLHTRRNHLKLGKQEIEDIVKKTTRGGHLPTGSPTSPALGNVLLYNVDQELYNWCRLNKLRYTRYADDITISSRGRIPKSMIQTIIDKVRNELLKKRGYKINRKKIRVFSKKNRMEVTGVVVNEKQPGISRKERDRIRAAIHQAKTQEDLQSIEGRISWVQQVQPRHARRLLSQLSNKKSQMQLKP